MTKPSLLQNRLFALALVLLFGILFRLVYYTDQVLWESVSYAERANTIGQMLNGPINEKLQALQEIRLAPRADRVLLAAASTVFSLFKADATTSGIVAILGALLIGIFLWAIGKLVISNGAGLLATFLWLALPVGVFATTQLLPIVLSILLNLLVVYFYLYASDGNKVKGYIYSGILLSAGLWLNWTTTLASGVFIVLEIATQKLPQKFRSYTTAILLLVSMMYLFASQSSKSALQLIYLSRMIEENLILFPLLTLSVLYTASLNNKSQLQQQLSLWFAVKLLFMFVAARWLEADPLVQTIGVAGYWLDLMLPGMLLVGWALSDKLGENQVLKFLPVMCICAAIALLVASHTSWLMTVSRIAFGLTIPLFALLLGYWGSQKSQVKFIASLFLLFFLVGTFSLVHSYWLSYRHAHDNTQQMIATLAEHEKSTLFVQEEELFTRISYLLGFKPSPIEIGNSSLTFEKATSDQSAGLPVGSYTAISAHYRDFQFGPPLLNWELVETFGTGPTQLLLFRVTP